PGESYPVQINVGVVLQGLHRAVYTIQRGNARAPCIYYSVRQVHKISFFNEESDVESITTVLRIGIFIRRPSLLLVNTHYHWVLSRRIKVLRVIKNAFHLGTQRIPKSKCSADDSRFSTVRCTGIESCPCTPMPVIHIQLRPMVVEFLNCYDPAALRGVTQLLSGVFGFRDNCTCFAAQPLKVS